MATLKNVISYGGGPKPGQMIVGNGTDGTKTTLFDAATVTDGSYKFHSCTSLTSWSVDMPNLTKGENMFYGCTGLTSWTAAMPNLTNGYYMFRECTGLTSWTTALPRVVNVFNMFRHTRLTRFDVDLPEVENSEGMFDFCVIETFTGAVPKLKKGYHMFYNCAKLRDFLSPTPSLEDGREMFNFSALSEESVRIVTGSLQTFSEGSHIIDFGVGEDVSNDVITEVSAALAAKGWTSRWYRNQWPITL